jgi:hypothetical protein
MRRIFLFVVALCVWGSVAAADPVVFDNITPNGGPNYAGNSPASQLSTGGQYVYDAGAADDFVLSATTPVTDVHWIGLYFNGSQVPIRSYNIVFWPDANGVPAGGTPAGPPNYAQALAIYNIAGTCNETADVSNPGIFTYFTDLPVPFVAQGGLRYWLEVQPVFDFPPQWAWLVTNGRQGMQAVQGFDYLQMPFWSQTSATEADLCFVLTGTGVPTPGALAMFIPLAGGLLVARRCRSRKAA